MLNDLSHDRASDLDLLLTSPDGRQAVAMSDVGGLNAVTTIDLTLDDEATASLPDNAQLTSGPFKPADLTTPETVWPEPAPAGNTNVVLRAFDGADPNGTWRLWIRDDNFLGNAGAINGWSLQITAETDVQVPVTKKKQKKKK